MKKDAILPIVGDIGDDKFRESLIATTVDKFKRIDVLVNNAGEERRIDSLQTRDPDFQKAYFSVP